MKLLLTITALLAAHASALDLPPEMKEMLDQIEQSCKGETGVDPAVLDAARKFDFKDDPKFKCFLKCMMTNMQILGDEGELDHEAIEQSLPEEIKKMGAMDIVEKCRSTKGSDICDTAYKLVLCFYEHGKELAEVFT